MLVGLRKILVGLNWILVGLEPYRAYRKRRPCCDLCHGLLRLSFFPLFLAPLLLSHAEKKRREKREPCYSVWWTHSERCPGPCRRQCPQLCERRTLVCFFFFICSIASDAPISQSLSKFSLNFCRLFPATLVLLFCRYLHSSYILSFFFHTFSSMVLIQAMSQND